MPFFVLPTYESWQPTLTMLTEIGRPLQAWRTALPKTESWLYGLLPHTFPGPGGQLMLSVVLLGPSNCSSFPWQGVNEGSKPPCSPWRASCTWFCTSSCTCGLPRRCTCARSFSYPSWCTCSRRRVRCSPSATSRCPAATATATAPWGSGGARR